MRYILFIAEDYLLVNAIGRSGFSNGVVFESSDVGRSKFSEYLQERSSAIFTGVVDTSDQEYKAHDLPKLGRMESKLAINSVIHDKFSDSLLWSYRSHKIESEAKKGVQLRVSSVAQTSACAHWFEILEQHQVLVSELCLLSDVCAEISKNLALAPAVLVLQLSECDYRITGFRENNPLIYRKVFLEESGEARRLIAEIDRTRLFVNRAVAGDHSDSVVFIGNASEQYLKLSESPDVVFSSPAEVLSRVCRCSRVEVTSMELIMQLMLKKHVRMANRLSGDYRTPLLRRRSYHGYTAGILCCVSLAAVSSVAAAWVTESLHELASEVRSHAEVLDERLVKSGAEDSVMAELLPIDAIRASVQLGTRLQTVMAYSPIGLLRPLARELSRVPEVQINSVNWQLLNSESVFEQHDVLQYEASVSGQIEIAKGGIGELVRNFNRFITGLESSDRIDFVEVREFPFGRGLHSSNKVSGSSDNDVEFTILLSVRDLMEGSL